MTIRNAPLEPGIPIEVRLVKLAGPTVSYGATVVSDDGIHLIVRGPWAEAEPRDLGFVCFEPGDIFTEHYWRDRWYSIKEVRGPTGVRKGWYCDVARPVRITNDLVVSEDLDLDLWASADGNTILRLDEDEFAANGLADSDPGSAAQALEALAALERLANERFEDLLRSTPEADPWT